MPHSIRLCLLSGWRENAFRFLFCPHAYLPSVALTHPYGFRQGPCAGIITEITLYVFLSTLTAGTGGWNIGKPKKYGRINQDPPI